VGGYSFTTMVAETEEYAASLPWAHAIGKLGLERLRTHHFAVIISFLSLILYTYNSKDWDPLINKVLETFPDMDAYPLEAAPWMKSLIHDNAVAFVGDAAHRKESQS